MREPVVRSATPSDRAAVEAVVDRAFEVYIPAIGEPPRPMTADYGAWIAEGVVEVIEVGGAVRGVVVHWPEGEDLYVEVVAVDPDEQGTGLGARLLDHLAARAREGGLAALRLHTNEAMVDSLGWYLRHGFDEVGRVEVHGFRRVELVRRLPRTEATGSADPGLLS